MNDLGLLTNRWLSVSMVLACLALITSFLAGYYWFQYTDILDRLGGVAIYVNVGIDYGNQNLRAWHNATKALTGMTLFKVIRGIANITFETSAYVESINGLFSNASHGWVWWKWDTFEPNWTRIDIGADSYAVADNETFLWYYESGWPPPMPPPG